MAVLGTYEQFTARKIYAFRLVDRFAASLGTLGAFPPIVGGLEFFLTERTDVARKYDPPREVLFWRGASGNYLTGGDVLGATRNDPKLSLAPGDYRIRVSSDYYLPAEIEVQWPPAGPVDKDLLPSAAYPFPDATANPPGFGVTVFRGTLFQPDGKPSGGVEVSVDFDPGDWSVPADWADLAKTKTGEDGEWVVALPDERLLRDQGPPDRKPEFAVVLTIGDVVMNVDAKAGRENVFTQASLRGTAADRFGRPLGGVTVTNDLQAGVSATDRNGKYAIYFPMDQGDEAHCNVEATSPDGFTLSEDSPVKANQTVIVPRFQFP